jgi:hypothetical protein
MDHNAVPHAGLSIDPAEPNGTTCGILDGAKPAAIPKDASPTNRTHSGAAAIFIVLLSYYPRYLLVIPDLIIDVSWIG